MTTPASSKRAVAASTMESRWPPRSPHEALLCSPSGRNRLRQFNDRTSPSRSPLKKSSTTPNLNRLSSKPALRQLMEEDEEEDEETLQLRLDAIEARLKLKKLQRKKTKAQTPTSDIEKERPPKPGFHMPAESQIPVSPPRKPTVVEEKKSPSRVLLGIDKGLKGHNVSLKRPPTKASTNDDPFTSRAARQSSRGSTFSRGSSTSYPEQTKKASFSDRISQSRRLDKEETEKANRVWEKRSTGFGVDQEEIERHKGAAESNAKSANKNPTQVEGKGFSRDEVLKAIHEPNTRIPRSKSLPKLSTEPRSRDQASPSPQKALQPRVPAAAQSSTNPQDDSRGPSPPSAPAPRSTTPPSDSLFEPFSTLHLSKRILPHAFLTRTFASKSIALIPSLLSQIKSPSYVLPPDLESDFIVLGIIASKSSPLTHKDAHKSTTAESTSTAEAAESEANTRGKYMVMTLTDLKWTLDLYLFTTAYTRFWKLTPGTLIAILNPSIMPPPPGKTDTGRFSLVLDSSDDTVLEIGTSRDLSWCKSLKRNGQPCESWIDKRHTSVCEFHIDRVVERTRAGRMEVNGISAPYGPKGRRGGRTGFWGGSRKRKDADDKHETGLLPEGKQYDRGLGTNYFIAPHRPGSRSAAALLDAEAGGPLERGGDNASERARKRLAAQEKEKEIARRLGQVGNGTAAEYLRQPSLSQLKPAPSSTSNSAVEAAGLLAREKNAAEEVRLSPVRKKRKGDADGDEGEKKKKTRFVTFSQGVDGDGGRGKERDIWLEAGREADEEDEDDELEVV